MSPQAKACVFLRYSTGYKGYQLPNLQSNKVRISHHVQFHEHVFPFLIAKHNDDYTGIFHDRVLPIPISVEQRVSSPLNQSSGANIGESARPRRISLVMSVLNHPTILSLTRIFSPSQVRHHQYTHLICNNFALEWWKSDWDNTQCIYVTNKVLWMSILIWAKYLSVASQEDTPVCYIQLLGQFVKSHKWKTTYTHCRMMTYIYIHTGNEKIESWKRGEMWTGPSEFFF